MALPSLWRWGRGREVPIRRNDASESIVDLYSEVDRLFEDFWRGFGPFSGPLVGSAAGSFEPRISVEETDSEIRLTAELPGLEEKDFELSLDRDTLTLRGEKREERGEHRRGGWHDECLYGSFMRRVPLRWEIEADRAEARFKNGVLTVTLPKSEEARQRRVAIPVNAA